MGEFLVGFLIVGGLCWYVGWTLSSGGRDRTMKKYCGTSVEGLAHEYRGVFHILRREEPYSWNKVLLYSTVVQKVLSNRLGREGVRDDEGNQIVAGLAYLGDDLRFRDVVVVAVQESLSIRGLPVSPSCIQSYGSQIKYGYIKEQVYKVISDSW